MRYLTIIFLFIATFATGQQQMFLRSTPAAGVTGILDSYTGSAAAYATALLYSGYSGSCLRVRRDSDNAEQDIGFSGQDIDEAAINTFCSGANCFVKTWYDQSGNGNDATQTTTANQPKIYDSATGIIYENSVVALSLDGSNDYFNLAISISASADSLMFGFEIITTTANNKTVGLGSVLSPGVYTILGVSGTTYIDNRSQYKIYSGRFYGQRLFTSNTSDLLGWQNGSSIAYGTAANLSRSTDFTTIGRVGNDYGNQKLQFGVYYRSDQSANRTGIETIINNYFSIY